MIDGKDVRNEEAEKFFNFIYENEPVNMTQISIWKKNYYMEIEIEEAFHSRLFENQDLRIDSMFPQMPNPARNLIALKSYKHRAKSIDEGGHDETGNEERIGELEVMVAETAYEEFVAPQWWSN